MSLGVFVFVDSRLLILVSLAAAIAALCVLVNLNVVRAA